MHSAEYFISHYNSPLGSKDTPARAKHTRKHTTGLTKIYYRPQSMRFSLSLLSLIASTKDCACTTGGIMRSMRRTLLCRWQLKKIALKNKKHKLPNLTQSVECRRFVLCGSWSCCCCCGVHAKWEWTVITSNAQITSRGQTSGAQTPDSQTSQTITQTTQRDRQEVDLRCDRGDDSCGYDAHDAIRSNNKLPVLGQENTLPAQPQWTY